MKRYFTRAGFALVLTGLMTLSLAAAGGANADRDNDDNPTCDGYDHSYKIEDPANDTYTVNRDGLVATFTVDTHPDVESPNESNAVTSFSANLSSGIVIVKGGNGANIYDFDAATLMHSPTNASGKWPTISHVQLCWDETDTPDEPGRIEVNKQVLGEGAPDDAEFTFALTGPGAEGGTQYRTVTANGAAVFDDLRPGSYLVTEVDLPDGFDVETDLPMAVEVAAGHTYQVRIQNRFRHQNSGEGSVEVTKVVIGSGAPADAEFTISLTGPGSDGETLSQTVTAGETATFTGLDPGLYTVTEGEMPDGFVATGLPEEIRVTGGHTVTLDVVNQYHQSAPELGTAQVTKIVVGSGAPEDAEFTIALTGPGIDGETLSQTVTAGETAEFTGLDPGLYTVTEGEMPDGFVATGLPTAIEVTAGQVATLDVVNQYRQSAPPEPGTVQVTKAVTGDAAPTDAEFTFSLTGPGTEGETYNQTVTAGETATFDGLEPGEYVLTETSMPIGFSLFTDLPATVTVVEGQIVTKTVVNDYEAAPPPPPELGVVVVTKQVTGVDATDAEFELCLTGPAPDGSTQCATVVAGAAAVFDGLVPGTYAVSETDVPQGFFVVTTLPMKVSVLAGQTTLATVTNEYVERESSPPAVEDDSGQAVDTETTDVVSEPAVAAVGVDAESGVVATTSLPETGSSLVLAFVAVVLMTAGGALLLLGRRPEREMS